MVTDGRLAFVGPGVMAEAMLASLIARGDVDPGRIVLSGPRPARLDTLREQYGVEAVASNPSAVENAEVIVLTIKPQSVPDVMEDLRDRIPRDALVASIVAGTTIGRLAEGLGHASIVRAMPNTPGQIGEGITVWTASDSVSVDQREQARWLLSAMGQELEVEHEDYLDMATALSGTGPAYVFLFMEAMIDAGVHMGFPRRVAEQLVVETIRGSLEYYTHSASHPARLRNQVTSPGGTSAEALYYLDKAGFRTALARAIWAAYERSVQLGKGTPRTGE